MFTSFQVFLIVSGAAPATNGQKGIVQAGSFPTCLLFCTNPLPVSPCPPGKWGTQGKEQSRLLLALLLLKRGEESLSPPQPAFRENQSRGILFSFCQHWYFYHPFKNNRHCSHTGDRERTDCIVCCCLTSFLLLLIKGYNGRGSKCYPVYLLSATRHHGKPLHC